MNIPKWLLPVIGVIAAVAVGVAAVLIGMQFANPATGSAFTPPQTQTATVLAPVSVGDQADGVSDDGSDGGDGGGSDGGGSSSEPAPSPEVGEREVAVPEEDPAASDAETLNLIDLLSLDPDILAGILRLDLGTIGGDPCSPTDGSTPPDDCPEGALMGAIFADRVPPPFLMLAEAWPRTHAVLGDTRSGIGEMQCDPPTRVEGQAILRIRSTLPGSFSIRYYPSDHPENAVETVPTEPSAQQQADWQTQFEMEPVGYLMAEQCVVIDGLDPNTAYTAIISGHDIMGREAAPRTVLFNSDGEPGHPEISVQTIGQNLLTASVLHRPDETVILQAHLVDAGSAQSCDTPSTATDLGTLTNADHIPATAAERNRLNADRQYSQKLFYSYRVPEGATVLLCARWFPGGSTTPSWESAQANYESSVIVQSADRVNPGLTMTGFTPRDDRTVDLHWKVSTAEGLVCGEWDWSYGDMLPLELCNTSFTASGGVDFDFDSSRISDRGFDGDLVLTVSARLSSGETSETTYVLPAGSGSCVGSCPVPPISVYRVATIGGTMDLTEHWDQGLQNGGLDHWNVSSTVGNPIDYVRPDSPQIDPTPIWEYTWPTDGFYPYLDASIDLNVDRPVTWEVTTLGGPRGGPVGLTCDSTDVPLVDSGSSESGVIHIELDHACIASAYSASLRLVDEDGNVSIWNAADRTHYWGAGAILNTPAMDVELRYHVDASYHPEGTDRHDYLKRFNLILDGFVYPLANDLAEPAGTLCIRPDGDVTSDGTIDLTIGRTVNVGVEVRSGRRSDPGSGECSGTAVSGAHSSLTSAISIAAFNHPEGVLVSWGPSVIGSVRIWLERR